MATKKFSPAQIAAQKLFAERARAGTLGKGKRKANPVKGEKTFKNGDYVKTDRGEIGRVSFYKDQPKGYANVYRLIDVKANDPYASTFLENGNFINGTRLKAYKQTLSKGKRKPNPGLYENINAKRNPEAIPYAMADVEKFHLGGKMYAEIVKKANNSYDYVVYQMYSTGISGEKPREQFFDSKNYKTKTGAMRGLEKYVQRLGYKINPDKSKPRAYVKRASQATGAPSSKRLVSRRKMALSSPAGYFPNPSNQKLSAIDVDFLTGRKNIFGEINTPSEKKAQLEFLKNSRMTSKPVRSKYYNLTARVNRKTNPAAAMMTGYQVICMHPKKHVVGIFKTMAEAKMVATAMANAKGVPYGVKAVKVHKSHFAV